jgi:hypothetical protein
MRFQVPQYIEVKDKIFGPLTLSQFIYLGGGAGIIYLLTRFLPIWLAIFLALPVAILSLALAFYKVHGRPFVNVLEAALKWSIGRRLFIWRKIARTAPSTAPAGRRDLTRSPLFVPRYSSSKLSDLAWNLDIAHKENSSSE